MKDDDGNVTMTAGHRGDTGRRERPWQDRLRKGSLALVVALSAAMAGVLVQQSFAGAPVSAPARPVTVTHVAAALVATDSPVPSSPTVPRSATPLSRAAVTLPTAPPAKATPRPRATTTPSVTATPRPRATATPSATATPRPRATATPPATPRPRATATPPATPTLRARATSTSTMRPAARPTAALPARWAGPARIRSLPPPATNVYADTLSGRFNPKVVGMPVRVYVPNSGDGTIDVINPATFQIVGHFLIGAIPHHITPAWDLSRLYVETEGALTMAVIDPRTGRPAGTIPVAHAYNLYFTPDGRTAIVVVERFRHLEFRNPQTWRLIKSVFVPWPGIDHLDFSADGRYALASTEFSGIVVKVDTVAMKITGWINVGGLPIDVRLAPDGKVFYVANQGRDGVSIINPSTMKEVGFIPTGRGAHGLVVSRDTKSLYVANRLAGTISVIALRTRRVAATWHIGFSPDMLQLSPDGRQLWVSGRFDSAVFVVDTRTGRILHTIAVGLWPHGLSYFPNAGRFSLGHNGVYR